MRRAVQQCAEADEARWSFEGALRAPSLSRRLQLILVFDGPVES